MYKPPLSCLKCWVQEILVRNWIFLSRFFTLYMFMISPLNNVLLNETISLSESLDRKKCYFPSNHLHILLSFSEIWTIFFLGFFFFFFMIRWSQCFRYHHITFLFHLMSTYSSKLIPTRFTSCWTALSQCSFIDKPNIVTLEVAHHLSLDEES